jgi:hypothetical protein
MKFALLTLLLVPLIVNARTIGIGEHRYGPDTPENFACQIAEENAKQHAINRFLGEKIDSMTLESCKNEECILQRDTINESRGIIKNVLDKKIQKLENTGYLSCIVTIVADVVKITNNIKFVVFNENLTFKENDEVKFSAITNQTGQLVLFNFYNGNYYRIYEHKITSQNEKFVLPSNDRKLIAKLPTGESQSKELVMFVFFDSDKIKVKDLYSQKELREFFSSIPFESYRVVNRHVNILR